MKNYMIGIVIIVIASLQMVIITSAQGLKCSRSLSPRLEIGKSARVTPGLANNVRSAPESSTIVGQIPAGETFMVIGGPKCGNQKGMLWWEVEYEGKEGWTVESDKDEYWLEPLGYISKTVTPNVDLILQGLRWYPGGGYPGFGWCNEDDWPDNSDIYTPFSQFLGSSSNFVKIKMTPPKLGRFFYYSEPMAPICTRSQPKHTEAIGPNGEVVDLEIDSLYGLYSNELFGFKISLPPSTYFISGKWKIKVDDFNLTVLVEEISEPSLFLDYDGGVFFGGFEPNLPIYVITRGSRTHELIELKTDENGYGEVKLDSWKSFIGIIGQNGEGITEDLAKLFEEEVWAQFTLPISESLDTLYEMLWEGKDIDLSKWTCPGGLPIRLAEFSEVEVIVPTLNVFESAALDADIIDTLEQGSIVKVMWGVRCNDNATWWAIEGSKDEYIISLNFLYESRDKKYSLAPVPD